MYARHSVRVMYARRVRLPLPRPAPSLAFPWSSGDQRGGSPRARKIVRHPGRSTALQVKGQPDIQWRGRAPVRPTVGGDIRAEETARADGHGLPCQGGRRRRRTRPVPISCVTVALSKRGSSAPPEAGQGDLVFDLGAGYGAITTALAASGARVIAVERDQRLAGRLRRRFDGHPGYPHRRGRPAPGPAAAAGLPGRGQPAVLGHHRAVQAAARRSGRAACRGRADPAVGRRALAR
jgi:hypothetical protein